MNKSIIIEMNKSIINENTKIEKLNMGNQLNKRNKLRTQMLWKCTTSKSTKTLLKQNGKREGRPNINTANVRIPFPLFTIQLITKCPTRC